MAHFKIELSGPGKWVVNLFHNWQSPDPDYELVSPQTDVDVNVIDIPTYLTLYVSAKTGTRFTLTQDGTTILFEGVTGNDNLFTGHTRIK